MTLLVGAEDAGLAQHRVDERRLAVVDMGDDGQVAQVVAQRRRLVIRLEGRRRARWYSWGGPIVARPALAAFAR